MADVTLGSIERVDPRKVWADEAKDFTPWLRENLPILGETLGLQLEATDMEVAVGPFSADIVGKELTSGGTVVVENQLEQTDHSHLGQLLTYAGGLDAGVVIWVARQFREEHRQSLDWLNEITPPTVGFFGIELEVFRIEGSPPAPHFKVVVSPNETVKAIQAQSKAPSEKALRYQTFWKGLIGKLRSIDPGSTTASPEKVGTQSWFGISIGRTGFVVNFVFTGLKTARVELYIDMGNAVLNKEAFDLLLAEGSGIEADFGEKLSWDRLDGKQASRVHVERPGSIDDPPEMLQEFKAWGADRMLRMRKTFGPRVKGLALKTNAASEEPE